MASPSSTPSSYDANFPALFVEWAAQKIAEKRSRLVHGSLTPALKRQFETDISYLAGAIERIGSADT